MRCHLFFQGWNSTSSKKHSSKKTETRTLTKSKYWCAFDVVHVSSHTLQEWFNCPRRIPILRMKCGNWQANILINWESENVHFSKRIDKTDVISSQFYASMKRFSRFFGLFTFLHFRNHSDYLVVHLQVKTSLGRRCSPFYTFFCILVLYNPKSFSQGWFPITHELVF